MARALFIATFFFTMTPLLISLQWLLGKLNLLGWGFIASNYYRALCSLLRIRVRVNGEPVRRRAVLFVSNHVSRADILVIGSIAPVPLSPNARSQTGRSSVLPPRLSGRCSSIAHAGIKPAMPWARSSSASRTVPRSRCSRKEPQATAIACCRSALPCSAQWRKQPAVAASTAFWFSRCQFVTPANTDRKAMTKRPEDTVRRLFAAALRGRQLGVEPLTRAAFIFGGAPGRS
jgi:hypothetical protein